MIDLDNIRLRFQSALPFLNERSRRLFAASEAIARGLDGVTATAQATGITRSTIIDPALIDQNVGSPADLFKTAR